MPVLSEPGVENPIVFLRNRDITRSERTSNGHDIGWELAGFNAMFRPPF